MVFIICSISLLSGDAFADPVHMADAIMKGDLDRVKNLIEEGADVNAKDEIGRAPLHFVKNKAVAELLIAKGADVNARTKDGSTLLHTMAWNGNKEIAELLLENGADVNAKHKKGHTPLHFAVRTGKKEVVKLLLTNGALVNAKDEWGYTPLYWANKKGYQNIAELLLANGANKNLLYQKQDSIANPHMADAIMSRDADKVKELIKKGADVSAKDSQGSTALDYAEKKEDEKLNITSVAFSDSNIAILWEKDIIRSDANFVKPYTIKVDGNKDILRVVGVSYVYKRQETPKKQNPELFEYRLNLKDNTSESKTLMKMNEEDITVYLRLSHMKDSRLIDGNIVIIRNQYKSFNFQELILGSNCQVKTGEIPGLTRLNVSTHGACRNMNGDVFLCGNSGYIRKVKSNGSVAWDTNYKSDKGEDGTFAVAFSESENVLVAFGFSFEPDTKFTTKDSSLWLANLDSEGNFKVKTEFEGIANFGKNPSFCLSKSDNPVVIYDNAEMGSYKIYVSKFTKDLKKDWTTHIFDANDMMMSRMSLTPLENDCVLAILSTFATKGKHRSSLYFYILDGKGIIVNNGVFNDIRVGPGFVSTAYKDKIFIVKEDHILGGTEDTVAKLLCFKINP